MFERFLFLLRAEGLPVGLSEWLTLLRALGMGLVHDVDGFYALARAVLCRTEADYDAFDLAFAAAFADAQFDPARRAELESWLEKAKERVSEELVAPDFGSDQELWEAFLDRLDTQDGRHDGGNHWVGTGGTSPFGHSGRASRGVRVGGKGGNRGAIQVASDRQWESYRTDSSLEIRDFSVALKALRKLQREGRYELDLPETIEQTGRNAGEIEIVERRARENQVRLVLIMDAGGSMAPHAERVTRLFTAAEELNSFRSFESWFFHNCPYNWLWSDFEAGDRTPTSEVLAKLTPRHRLVFVGDAAMAPWELFSSTGWGFTDQEKQPGVEWLRRFKKRCPASIWLNPDPRRWWDHPTVSAIGGLFPMFELTVDGLREGIRTLRKPV